MNKGSDNENCHTQNALRFIMQGDGAFTALDGLDISLVQMLDASGSFPDQQSGSSGAGDGPI